MNGERRDTTPTSEDRATPATRPPATPEQGNQPLLEAIDTESVSRTTVVKQDAALAPLFAHNAATDFRLRWNRVQRDFVDDPTAAVRAADELVAQVTESLTETFARHRSALEQCLDQTDAATTETLRIALRQYRSFFERLLSI
jgi:hypothetical protein